jgi:hypothetical protein
VVTLFDVFGCNLHKVDHDLIKTAISYDTENLRFLGESFLRRANYEEINDFERLLTLLWNNPDGNSYISTCKIGYLASIFLQS